MIDKILDESISYCAMARCLLNRAISTIQRYAYSKNLMKL